MQSTRRYVVQFAFVADNGNVVTWQRSYYYAKAQKIAAVFNRKVQKGIACIQRSVVTSFK